MKKSTVILFFVATIVIATGSEAQDIHSSARSRAAISRIRPQLQREFSGTGFRWGAPIFVRIFKKTKELEIWLKDRENFRLFKTYKICTYGWRYLGPKIRQGDGRAPEGFYYVLPRQMNPQSNYHLSFNLGYPNAYDRTHGRTGSALMVHGKCVSIGCYAMTDRGIEEIFAVADASLRKGQRFFRVHIFPFRMTDKNMDKHKYSGWYKFWENLKEGYDFFEKNGHNPPNVKVKNKRYVFEPS
jgi:murein L,D-transpeptidase YafK